MGNFLGSVTTLPTRVSLAGRPPPRPLGGPRAPHGCKVAAAEGSSPPRRASPTPQGPPGSQPAAPVPGPCTCLPRERAPGTCQLPTRSRPRGPATPALPTHPPTSLPKLCSRRRSPKQDRWPACEGGSDPLTGACAHTALNPGLPKGTLGSTEDPRSIHRLGSASFVPAAGSPPGDGKGLEQGFLTRCPSAAPTGHTALAPARPAWACSPSMSGLVATRSLLLLVRHRENALGQPWTPRGVALPVAQICHPHPSFGQDGVPWEGMGGTRHRAAPRQELRSTHSP